jgi:hypothetical protein
MPMHVDGELLAEGQLHDGLTLPASEEGRSAAQHTSDEGEQRLKHSLILAAAGVEWEPETRAAVALFSTDEDGKSWETRAKSIRTNIGNAHPITLPIRPHGILEVSKFVRSENLVCVVEQGRELAMNAGLRRPAPELPNAAGSQPRDRTRGHVGRSAGGGGNRTRRGWTFRRGLTGI